MGNRRNSVFKHRYVFPVLPSPRGHAPEMQIPLYVLFGLFQPLGTSPNISTPFAWATRFFVPLPFFPKVVAGV